MAADSQKSHRAGPFKQKNKSHKTGRHRSKSQIETEHKGKQALIQFVYKLFG